MKKEIIKDSTDDFILNNSDKASINELGRLRMDNRISVSDI